MSDSGAHQGLRPLRYPETHLLRRLAVCGICDLKMTSLNSGTRRYRYYWCRGTDPNRIKKAYERCPHPTISAPELYALVWSDVVSLLTNPELLVSAWKEQNKIGHKQDLNDDEKLRLKQQITDADNQRKRILDAYEEGAIELEELAGRRNVIDEKIKKIKMKLSNFTVKNTQEVSITDFKKNIDEVCRSLSS